MCCDESYYVGSSKDIYERLEQHQSGLGANYTRKRIPVKLVYFEEFENISDAFYREKIVQRYSRKKKEALIKGDKIAFKKASRGKNQKGRSS